MDWLVTPFSSNGFMLHALIAGVLVSIACAIAGTFVILRGLAFIGDALAHGVLPGIAVAILVGFPGIIGAAIGAAGHDWRHHSDYAAFAIILGHRHRATIHRDAIPGRSNRIPLQLF